MQDNSGVRRRTYCREWRKQRGLSQEKVASSIGMSTPNLSRLERGLIPYNQDTLEALAGAFDTQPANLLYPPNGGGAADMGVANTSPGPEITGYLPLISWVRAGEWTEIADPLEPGTYEKLILVTRRYSNRAFALRLDGDSMQAPDGDSFPSGSIICVEPMQQAKNGSYVVIRLESSNEATFKQLIIDGAREYLKPLNPRYPIMEITEPATICGVVRQLVMDFGK